MEGKREKRILCFLLLAVVFLYPFSSHADNFPQRPIRMIITYSAGGGTDVLGRAFQAPFEKALGTKIIIDNIPAGTTKIGTMEAMKAKPDGYAIILMPDTGWVTRFYSGTYDFKVYEKLTPLGNITSEPYGFVEVTVESPFKTWKDLVKAGKEKPGQLTCGGPGEGALNQAIMVQITKAAGIKTKYVPFAGAGPSKIALLGGHVDFRICQPTEAISMIRAGKTRGLAVSTEVRMKTMPDVPTFKELGIGEVPPLTRSIWGPPNMDKKRGDYIAKAIEKAAKDPDFIKLVEEEFLYTVEFRSGKKLLDGIIAFDREYGPMLAEIFKN
jgi:tripartite-type tricarboxylate transporter receptor subunit TctC